MSLFKKLKYLFFNSVVYFHIRFNLQIENENPVNVLFTVIVGESGSGLVFSHLSVLWKGKEKDEALRHLLSVGWASADKDWALLQMLFEQSPAASKGTCA